MLDFFVVGTILCIITAMGVVLFRRARQNNPSMAPLVILGLVVIEVAICLIADM